MEGEPSQGSPAPSVNRLIVGVTGSSALDPAMRPGRTSKRHAALSYVSMRTSELDSHGSLLLAAIKDLSFRRSAQDVMDVVRVAARELTGADGVTFVLRENDHCYLRGRERHRPAVEGQAVPAHDVRLGLGDDAPARRGHRGHLRRPARARRRVPRDVRPESRHGARACRRSDRRHRGLLGPPPPRLRRRDGAAPDAGRRGRARARQRRALQRARRNRSRASARRATSRSGRARPRTGSSPSSATSCARRSPRSWAGRACSPRARSTRSASAAGWTPSCGTRTCSTS